MAQHVEPLEITRAETSSHDFHERTGRFRDVHVLAVFPDDSVVAERTLVMQGVTLQFIAPLDFQKLGINATPSAVIVDSAGKISSLRVGLLDRGQQQELIYSLIR